MRIDIRRTETLKLQNEKVGNHTRAKVVKNKVAPPFKEAEFDIMYGEGISKEGEICDLGVKCDLIKKSGAWFSYNDQRIGQGRENVKIFLAEHPDVAAEIEKKIFENKDKLMPTKRKKPGIAAPAPELPEDGVPLPEDEPSEAAKSALANMDIDIAVED